MRHTAVRTLIAGALASTLVGLTAGSASADRWWGADRNGDVQQWSYSPEPPPCGTVTETVAAQDEATDIVGLSVRHERATVELRAYVGDLTPWGGDRRLRFDVRTDGRAYEVSVMKWGKRQPIEATLLQAAPPPESFDECGGYTTIQRHVPCDLTLTRSPEHDVVSVVLPRSCLRGPRWVKAGVSTSRTVGDRFRWDRWSRTDSDPAVFSGPFGPRVRRD